MNEDPIELIEKSLSNFKRLTQSSFQIENGLSSVNEPFKVSEQQPRNIDIPVNPTYKLIEKQEEANMILGQIAENTSFLKELVQINRDTNLNVQELNDLMLDIYIISRANSKEEADNLFSKALNKISESGEKASNVASLTNVLIGIYNTVLQLL